MSLSGHVLVVDDHEDLRENLRALVEGDFPAVRVSVVASGKAALEVARREGFSVALVDLKLPDTSGVDLIPRLREVVPSGEVLLVTGFATLDAAIGALRVGAFALLLKGFRPEELRATLEQALLKVALRKDRDALERRYRALFEAADVVVFALDGEGRVALANPKLRAMLGVEGDLMGQRFVDHVAEADRGRFGAALAAVREEPQELEITLGERLVRMNLSTEREGPEAGLVFGVGGDVTERRALARRIAQAEALATMGTLALGLAHEIRNPLNAAVLQLHVLGREVEREVREERRGSMRDRVQIVVGEIKRLSRLLSEFLELSRPRGLTYEPVVLGELVDAVVELHAEEAAQRGVRCLHAGDERVVVAGDREKLKQALINLVVNAIDATPGGGAVRISARATDHGALLSVEDDGAGIADEDLARLFDPFFTTKPGGTGLGLSIVRRVIEQHGGEVHVESAPGRGTTVQIVLPAGTGGG
ncbi:MAG: response regulator [Myxococcales bacterium]|nr:response regulator [Myxococcales bacterium]